MGYSVSNVQKIYINQESTFGDGTSNFGTGVQLHPTEIVDLSGIKKLFEDNLVVRESRSEISTPILMGKEAKISLSFLLSGGSRDGSDIIQEDGLSKILGWFLGSNIQMSSNGTVGASSTTTKVMTADSYSAGQYVLIENQIRRISSIDAGISFDVVIPFSTAPSSGSIIYSTDYSTGSGGNNSISVGIEGDESEFSYLLIGGMCRSLKIDTFKSNEIAKITVDLEFADWSRGVTFTAPTTDLVSTSLVASEGDGLQMLDSSSNLWSPCTGSATAELGLGNEWVLDIGGLGGKCGFTSIIADDSGVELELYQDGTLSKLESLIGVEIPICIQIGKDSENVGAIYYESAYISEYPTASNLETINTVKVKFKTGQATIVRA